MEEQGKNNTCENIGWGVSEYTYIYIYIYSLWQSYAQRFMKVLRRAPKSELRAKANII